MTIVYTAPRQGDAVFGKRCEDQNIECIRVEHARDFAAYTSVDLFIDAGFDGFFPETETPLLFHSPAKIFSALKKVPVNSARFCAWPGFWDRELWEIATEAGNAFSGTKILDDMGIQAKLVADIPGLIAPRILCTIINEAAFAIHDGVASSTDIDIAMKLGTNYPYGPAEWARAIGFAEIEAVLTAMGCEDAKYLPHPKLFESFE